jgi:hypothetical protein
VIDFKVVEALSYKMGKEAEKEQRQDRSFGGLHGHRDEEFLARARAQGG